MYPWDAESDAAYASRLKRGEDKIICLTATYSPKHDVIIVVTDDLRMTFFKVTSRGNVTDGTVKPAGRVRTESQQHVVAVDDGSDRVFTAGVEKEVTVWSLREVKQKHADDTQRGTHLYSATPESLLSDQTEKVTSILVITDVPLSLSLLLTSSLSSQIITYDLLTLTPLRRLSGHTSGVRTMCYDGMGGLYSGGFEYDVFVWDLESSAEYPVNKLVGGHFAGIVKVESPYQSGRLCSLDDTGRFAWWDVRRTVVVENHDRLLQSFTTTPSVTSTFSATTYTTPALLHSTNGMTIIAAGKKIVAFDSIDVRPKEAPPDTAIYNPVGHSFTTVHDRDLKVSECVCVCVYYYF